MEVTVPVDVPLVGDERHKNWAKIVYSVDTSKDSGWAFEGEFIAVGGIQDVPAGSVLIVYGERGSRTNPQIAAQVFTVNADATLTSEASAKGPVHICCGMYADHGCNIGNRQTCRTQEAYRFIEALTQELLNRGAVKSLPEAPL